MEPIALESLRELKILFEWVSEREPDLKKSRTVLVGGWAVYSYNPYWGSVDIDLITNNTTKRSMRKYLLDNHGFHPDLEHSSASVYKDTKAGQVIIDFANMGMDSFEGNHDSLDLGTVEGNIEIRRIGQQEVPVPSRSFLLTMKIKAAWDRKWRLDLSASEPSSERDWELGKVIKDYSDILALIDPDKGGDNIEIEMLGDFFSEHEFIRTVIENLSESRAAATKYNIPHERAKGIVRRFGDIVL